MTLPAGNAGLDASVTITAVGEAFGCVTSIVVAFAASLSDCVNALRSFLEAYRRSTPRAALLTEIRHHVDISAAAPVPRAEAG